MLTLDEDAVRRLLRMEDLIPVMERALADFSAGKVVQPLRTIVPVAEPPAAAPYAAVDVVGPISESTDVFARARHLTSVRAGDLVAFTGAGAYGAVMASNYNSRPRAAEVMVEGTEFAVVKPRIEPAAGFADELLPPWLTATVLGRGAAG